MRGKIIVDNIVASGATEIIKVTIFILFFFFILSCQSNCLEMSFLTEIYYFNMRIIKYVMSSFYTIALQVLFQIIVINVQEKHSSTKVFAKKIQCILKII